MHAPTPPTLDASRARRVSMVMTAEEASPEKSCVAEESARATLSTASRVAALALLAAAMAVFLANGPRAGRAAEPVAETGKSAAHEAGSGGSLHGMNPRNRIVVAGAAAAAVTASLHAVPPGYVLVADSQAQFSGVQGQGGWWYLFDRGEGTAVEQLPNFVPFAAGMAWCSSITAGNDGSHCVVSRTACHPNTALNCNTPAAGDCRPLREWRSLHPLRAIVHLIATPARISPGMRLALLVDRLAAQSWDAFSGNAGTIDVTLDLGIVHSAGVLQDPLGSCHNDNLDNVLRVYTPDCNGDGAADYLEIANSPDLDADGNLVLDSCECQTNPALAACCPADLNRDGQVNGADIGAVLAFWGPNPAFPAADIDRSGAVDGLDLALLLAAWGPCGQ